MTGKENRKSAPPESPAPRGGLQLMALILLVMALLAIFSNVQKSRRDQLETVTIVPAPAATPVSAPSPP
ncbi:MAG: hypothetical protein H0W04_01840 [Chthoniobacterales bacterium]|nr:hypothetical protein [Chthoniobacterales bacterium]